MALNEKVANIQGTKKPSITRWTKSTIPGDAAAKIRAYKDASNNTYISGQGFQFLVLENNYYPKSYDRDNGDCFGYVFDNGNVVLYTWKSGQHNSPPPCGF